MRIYSKFALLSYTNESGTGQGILFDLVTDPEERVNLWDDPAYTAVKGELVLQLADRLAETDRLDAVRYCHA